MFWEVEEHQPSDLVLTPEKSFVIEHLKANHSRDECGRFVVPLPRKTNAPLLGESTSSAVRRYLSLEHSLSSEGKSDQFHTVMEEYLKLGHAELVPVADLQKPDNEIFYLPMHIVSQAQRRKCVLCLTHLNPHLESLLMILYWLGLPYTPSSLTFY